MIIKSRQLFCDILEDTIRVSVFLIEDITSMKDLRKKIKTLAFLAIGVSMLPANGSLNLHLNPTLANDIKFLNLSLYEYKIALTGTDPYVSATSLARDLANGETIVTFEYKSSKDVPFVQFYIGQPYSDKKSVKCSGLQATSDWLSYSADLSGMMESLSFGNEGEFIRLDFGDEPEIELSIRNLRFTTGEQQDEWKEDEGKSVLDKVLALGLPVLEITTVESEEPGCNTIDSPAGSQGMGITDAEKVSGSVRRIEPDGTVSFESGEYDGAKKGMTIKVRGNSSGQQPRKPYKIKLQTKADLLCSGNPLMVDKNWVLLNDYDMKLRNGFKINELVGLDWTPRNEYVNVIMNGFYRGPYLLCEAVERNTDCRIDVSKTGFIVELDAYWWNENGEYVPSDWNPVFNYTFKYPDYEDMDEDRINSIGSIMAKYETSLKDDAYTTQIDCESFARWVLGHDILGTYDYCGSNMYFSRYDDGATTLLRRPLMWDFDATEDTPDTWSHSHLYYYDKLFESKDRTFADTYYKLWEEEGKKICGEMISYLNDFKSSEEADAYTSSMNYINATWGRTYKSVRENAERSIKWYTEREPWIEEAIKEYAPSGGDSSVSESGVSATGVRFDGKVVSTAGGEGFRVYSSNGGIFATSSGESVSIDVPGVYVVVCGGVAQKILVK